jgi:DNA-3-methyladenine glycosylase II
MNFENKVELAKNDPILGQIIERCQNPVFNSTKNVFHDLMSCVVEQQIHYRSTKKIFSKAIERADIEILTIDNFYRFEKESLPHLNLAMGKYETMMMFAEYWSNNSNDFNSLTNEEVISALSSIKGIGKWTIDMILLFTLERSDIFPFDDFHLKQIMIAVYNLDAKSKLKAQMIKISENWKAEKSLAVLFLLEWKKQRYSKRKINF